MPGRTIALLVALLLAGGCAAERSGASAGASAEASAEADLQPAITRVTCGGPSFDLAVLDQPGGAELADDPAAAALRGHLTAGNVETDWLPDEGWIEATRTEVMVQYVARGGGAPLSAVTVELRDGHWTIGGWAQCRPRAEVAPGVNLAMFRVAPHEELMPETTKVDVLVTELACNSGQDASGRILRPRIISGADSVTVVMTVRPRGGGQECPDHPETPFVLELPEPLGDRLLLDGSEVPARDATECPERLCP